jgi:hypothetical protein
MASCDLHETTCDGPGVNGFLWRSLAQSRKTTSPEDAAKLRRAMDTALEHAGIVIRHQSLNTDDLNRSG